MIMEAATPAQSLHPHLSSQEKKFVIDSHLYRAAAEGDIEKFKEHKEDLDKFLTPNENTVLHIHITARQPEKPTNFWNIFTPKEKPKQETHQNLNSFVREILLKCPSLLWKANAKDETLLHIAARHGHADIVKILIIECKKAQHKDQENGVEAIMLMLGKLNKAKDTALHEAVRYNQLDVVKILTEEDPDLPYDVNEDDETPLYLAAERGYKDVVKQILSTCKSPADRGPTGRTALHAAVIRADKDNKEIIKILLENEGTLSLTSKADQIGWVPLHYAALFGNIDVVKELLTKDESAAYIADKEGKTALHLAAATGQVVILQEIILRCPGCCELVDNRGWNIFHFALDSENKKAVELLLDYPWLGNLINEKDKNGNTPLLQHAASGSYISSFIRHPKVDKLALNNRNQDAEAIILFANHIIWEPQALFLRCLRKLKFKRSWRLDPEDKVDEGKEGGNTVNNQSDEGKEEGIIVSNKSDEGKDKGNVVSDDGKEGSKRDNILSKYIKEAKDCHLVVAALIATVTFTAGITLPGGFNAEKGPGQGAAVLTRSKAFQAFVIFNTIAMIFSSCAVFIHLFITQVRDTIIDFTLVRLSVLFIIYAMFAMVLAFVLGTCAVLHHAKELSIAICAIGSLFFWVHAYYEPHKILLDFTKRMAYVHFIKLRTEVKSRIHLRRGRQ